MGTSSFIKAYVKEKVQKWVGDIARLSSIASNQPHAAYAALSDSLFGKWTYLMGTQPGISDLLEPLEEAICHKLPPCSNKLNDMKRNLIKLPAHLGGLEI